MIYVTGYKGRLGSHLVSMGCEPLDVDVKQQKIKIDLDPKEDVIINCAAKTNVDRCAEKNYYWDAIEVNGKGIANLAENWYGKIIHISTDYVFQGKRGAYNEKYDFYSHEDDLPTRKMSYGITKMMGEMNIRHYAWVHIIRTTGLYGGISGKSDFVNMLLDTFNIGVLPIKVTNELKGNQTYIPHLCEALIKCAETKQLPKLLHIASKEVITRYEFALMVASVFDLDKKQIVPCKNKDVPGWVEERPKKGGLKVGLAQKLGFPIYTILEGLEAYKNGN